MSVENLKEYARRCAVDPDLRAAAKEIGMVDMDAHMRHAGSMGLDWDRSDLVEFHREVTDSEGDLADLSEEELDQVAGGGLTVTAAVAVGVAAGAGAVAGVGAVGSATAAGHGGW